MRTIKFRAWDRVGKQGILGWSRILEIGIELFFKENYGFELMQFTGLLDKNSKEIYEGDILRVINPNGEQDNNCIVEWDNAGIYPYAPEDGYGDFDISAIGWAMELDYNFKVIGNIYENPN